MPINKNYKIGEGDQFGSQEAQALGTTQNQMKASVAVTKGMVVEATGDWTCGPCSDNSQKVIGIAMNDAQIGEKVAVDAEGFVKLSASAASIVAGDKIVAAAGGYVKKAPAIDLGASYVQATVNTMVGYVNGTIGICVAGCSSNGNPYVKMTL